MILLLFSVIDTQLEQTVVFSTPSGKTPHRYRIPCGYPLPDELFQRYNQYRWLRNHRIEKSSIFLP